ncbi:MAG: ATP-binding cassette domain-containing protein [Actinobacteria bacterium]|uniref:Unannotated protein n=1 Tax=freshwater metagenome TaxID=449393 RepID=A0A6J7ERW8_9ZZZZ|nr:ATP-binding cassette domain-containing protein [Actinomycetota bacterium]
MSTPLLQVENLSVSFNTEDGVVKAVDGVSWSIEAGQSLGIVGESGSGKTVGGLTLLGLTRSGRTTVSGRAMFEGSDLVSMGDASLRAVRGKGIAMIFQDPLSSLHPFYRVGDQIIEAIQAHSQTPKKVARARAAELLALVGIPDPKARLDAYPHEFSGGMRQRAMIAMALSNEPRLLIADEPTTALDVTVQAQILELLDRLRRELQMALVIITHDLGVVAETAEQVAVMYAGRIVEQSPVNELFSQPMHPYTWGLLRSIPKLTGPRDEALLPIPGRPPSLISRPKGCAFAERCAYAEDACRLTDPLLATTADGRRSACLIPHERRMAAWPALAAGGTEADALKVVRGTK